MSHLYDYGDGTTVTLAANTTVVGSGTLFLTAVLTGDHFYGPGDAKPYEVVAITDDTHLTLDRAWAGTTGAGQAYFIVRDSPLRSNARTASVQLSTLLTTYQSIINITGNDRYFNLDKTASGDNAGFWIKQSGTSLFRVGAFGDNDLHFQWLNGSTWTDALKITALGVLSFPSATGITSSSAQAFFVGRQGATNPAFLVDASASSSATGLKVTAAAAAGGVALAAISSGTNEDLTIDAKGSGTITLAGTSTGSVRVARAFVLTGAEDSQLQWSLGGQDWRINIQPNGDWYVFDRTATIYPLTIQKATGKVSLSNNLVVAGTTASTSTTTGSGVFGGGIGVAGAGHFGSFVNTPAVLVSGSVSGYGANMSALDCSSGLARLMAFGANTSTVGTLQIVLYSSNASVSATVVDTDTSGNIKFPSVTTTASAANAYLDGSNVLLKSTSSLRYKRNFTPFADNDVDMVTAAQAREIVMALRPGSYYSLARADDPHRMFIGLGAEDVATACPSIVHFDADDQPDGVMYDRVGVLTLAVVQQHDNRISRIEAELAALMAAA